MVRRHNLGLARKASLPSERSFEELSFSVDSRILVYWGTLEFVAIVVGTGEEGSPDLPGDPPHQRSKQLLLCRSECSPVSLIYVFVSKLNLQIHFQL